MIETYLGKFQNKLLEDKLVCLGEQEKVLGLNTLLSGNFFSLFFVVLTMYNRLLVPQLIVPVIGI